MAGKINTIDASGKILGRLAVEIAVLLRGKNKPNFSPNIPGEDKVVVINASKIKFSIKKLELKKYYHHSGYLGGIKEASLREVFSKDPNEVLRRAVFGMLPVNKLRASTIKRLEFHK